MKKQFNGAHFETEQGFKVSETEFDALKLRLPELGFTFFKKCRITDFVVPTKGDITRRMRIEKTWEGKKKVTRCIRGFKNHPIKGKKGKNVRLEDEKLVKPADAISFILSAMDRLKEPIPFYTKKRLHFQGKHAGFDFVITLDRAEAIGKFSGFYVEIETLLPLGSTEADVTAALAVIEALALVLFGEKRKPKISYRKMLMKTWKRKKKERREKIEKLSRVKKVKKGKKGKKGKKAAKKAKKKARKEQARKELKRDRTTYARLIRKVAPKKATAKPEKKSKPEESKE